MMGEDAGEDGAVAGAGEEPAPDGEPTAQDVPPIDSGWVDSYEPAGPYGAKEVGEGAIMPTIPAILNAIYDATGVRIYELPLTPQRVYEALQQAEIAKRR